MRSISRILNYGILGLLIVAFFILIAATQFRQKANEAQQTERVKLAALAARSSFTFDIAHYDAQLRGTRETILAEGTATHSEPTFRNQYKHLFTALPELGSLHIAFGDGEECLLFRTANSIAICHFDREGTAHHCDSKDEAIHPAFAPVSYKESRADWFSSALDNAGETAWTYEMLGEQPVLTASSYIPAKDSTDRLVVLAFHFDPQEVVSRIRMVPSRVEGIAVVRFPDGSIVYPKGERQNKELREICEHLAKQTNREVYSRIFSADHNDLTYKVFALQLPLEDLDPTLLSIIPDEERGFFDSMNVYIIGGFLVVFGLAFLLFLGWYKSHLDQRKINVHEERSKTQQRKLQQALGEREILDREVHHRVKNNLQKISSLLNMQLLKLQDGENNEEVFSRTKKRIESLGALHNAIYDAKDLRGIDMQEFLSNMAKWVKREFSPVNVNISYDVNAEGITADMDTALDIGMVAMELMVNAYQHGFPHATGGHVEVQLFHDKRDRYRLRVKDNGIGMGADLLDRENSSRMGLDIVDVLVEGLEGTFSYRTENGVKCEATLRIIPRESVKRPV